MSHVEHLFISDVHLGAFSGEKESAVEESLIRLIRYATLRGARLYVLGDLFDYWMEYPKSGFVPAIGNRVLEAFEEYNNKVSSALYITGNHDNWTFGHFRERGFDVEPEARIIQIDNKRILLMHGDGAYGKRHDLIRPLFHRMLRNPAFIHTYQALFPPDFGLALMKRFSQFSKRRQALNPAPLDRQAEQILGDEDIQVVLCGHDHMPRSTEYPGGLYVNLGTFFHHGTMVRYINGRFKLVTWSPDTQEFYCF